MEHTRNPRDVAIVGGGICGLTAALALEQRGIVPTVYEAASEYRPAGAGILLQTNALLVFERLGIVDRVRDAGVPLDDSQIRSPDGRVLKRFDVDGVESSDFGYGFVAIHRGDLQRILLDELTADVETGMACAEVTGPEAPTVRFEDGTRVEPDLVVGADGIGSAVRDAVAPDVDPRALDAAVYRGVASLDLPEPHCSLGFEVWGDGTYTGGAPIGPDRFYWFATVPEASAETATDPTDALARLRDRYAEFPAPVPSVVESLDGDDLIVTGLADVPSLERWHRGSVVLAGDAAHAMLPFAGQGAAQAIEDALALAHAVDTHDEQSVALEAYERERKPRADRVRAESRRLGELGTMQSSVGCRLRNLCVGLLPHAVFRKARRRRVSGTSLPESERPT